MKQARKRGRYGEDSKGSEARYGDRAECIGQGWVVKDEEWSEVSWEEEDTLK